MDRIDESLNQMSIEPTALFERAILEDVNNTFTVQMIMTPKDQLCCWQQETDPSEIQEKIRREEYNQVPVVDENENICGMAVLDPPERIMQRGMDFEPLSPDWLISANTSIRACINIFPTKKHPACFVLQGDQIIGMVTIADMNKAISRTVLYLLFSQLEQQIAKLIQKQFNDSDDYIRHLRTKKQECYKKVIDKMQRADVKLNIIERFELSDLTTILEKCDSLRKRLGWPNSTQANKHLGSLIEFRKRVAHPVRLIVENHESADKLRERLENVENILSRVTNALNTFQT